LGLTAVEWVPSPPYCKCSTVWRFAKTQNNKYKIDAILEQLNETKDDELNKYKEFVKHNMGLVYVPTAIASVSQYL